MAGTSTKTSDGAAGSADLRTRLLVAAISLAVLLGCAGTAWWVITSASNSGDAAVDKRETLELRQRWQASYDAIVPIAKDFTGTTSGTIDVTAYTARIARARVIVDAINEVPVTLPANRDVRDSMLSGASEVLDGMDALLRSASVNDTAGVDTAVIAIDEGSTRLKEAGAALDAKIAAKGWR